MIVDLTSKALTGDGRRERRVEKTTECVCVCAFVSSVDKLREQRIECPTEDKDIHLYAFLVNHPGARDRRRRDAEPID